MKNKKRFLIIVIALLLIVALIGILYVFTNNQKNDSYIEESIGSKLVTAKINDEEEQNQIISIITNDNEDIKLTSQDISYYKILNPNSENIEEDIINNKIFSIEAKNRNIQLSNNEIDQIEEIVNSEEILEGINSQEEKEEIQRIIYEYLEDIEYSSKLKSQILDEISEGNLSIQDGELNQLLYDYNKMQEQAKSLTDETEKEELFKNIYQQLMKIQNLYYSKIRDKYLTN